MSTRVVIIQRYNDYTILLETDEVSGFKYRLKFSGLSFRNSQMSGGPQWVGAQYPEWPPTSLANGIYVLDGMSKGLISNSEDDRFLVTDINRFQVQPLDRKIIDQFTIIDDTDNRALIIRDEFNVSGITIGDVPPEDVPTAKPKVNWLPITGGGGLLLIFMSMRKKRV